MKLVKISDYFDVKYGNGLELNRLTKNKSGINFISRTSKNNGVSSKVKLIDTAKLNPAGTISVSVGGSVLEAFLQEEDYYTGYHILYLNSKIKLSEVEKLYYCMCIRANKYRYNYGRQANKTLKDIEIPHKDEIPNYVYKYDLNKFDNIFNEARKAKPLKFDTSDWKEFQYDEIFNIHKGFYNKKPKESKKKEIPFIGATAYNNGITSYHLRTDVIKTYNGNCITVANNGNSVASSFYQPIEFTCTHDINVLYIKDKKMNVFIGLFLSALIKKERYRWSYGRKWRPIRMPFSIIKLPVDKNEKPDWDFMEKYIKSLPLGKNILGKSD